MRSIDHAPRKARLPVQPDSFDSLTDALTNDEIQRSDFLLRLFHPRLVDKEQWKFTPADFQAVRRVMSIAQNCPAG